MVSGEWSTVVSGEWSTVVSGEWSTVVTVTRLLQLSVVNALNTEWSNVRVQYCTVIENGIEWSLLSNEEWSFFVYQW